MLRTQQMTPALTLFKRLNSTWMITQFGVESGVQSSVRNSMSVSADHKSSKYISSMKLYIF